MATFKRQIKSLGFSYDWDREINTTDPRYFKWTQWIFLQLYKKGLAYLDEVAVNWCPALGTVLANEEVIDGRSERGNHPVIRKPMKQWVLKITEYAERLLQDLDDLEELAETVKNNSLCALGQTSANPVISTVKHFRDEYLAHIVDKRCPAKVCKNLMQYKIDPTKCMKCSLCARMCPTGAITGKVREIPFVIDPDKCIKCGTCIAGCKFGAISKE